ncbi:uncharacterized protein LOC129589509 [Paramacrobiotus metropolitanus]|uniref:uncharacterized protein LOC129589509 n=1 Tax=Paramacrobiotus metropolitanus TaxID=2943436 RepID=UPI002445E6D4|nr:uncharacterized protein LOC129589509 [Paramacrobiotus metropolitanus]
MASEAVPLPPQIPYRLAAKLSHSERAEVWLAHRTDGIRPVEIAVKEVYLGSNREIAHVRANSMDTDLRHILSFAHPNLVRHLAQYNPPEAEPKILPYYIIIMEYCSGGDLHEASQFYIPAPLIQNWTRQIVDGLAYLHALHFVHSEITGKNILLSSTDWNSCQMKIANLDTTQRFQSNMALAKEMSKSGYEGAFTSPEGLVSGNVNHKSDIWSLGCVLLEMISGSPRFVKEVDGKQVESQTHLMAMYYIGTGGLPKIPKQLSHELRAFVVYFLKRDPVLRPMAAELSYTNFLTLDNVSQWPDSRPLRK